MATKAMSEITDAEIESARANSLKWYDDPKCDFYARMAYLILANQYDVELTRRKDNANG